MTRSPEASIDEQFLSRCLREREAPSDRKPLAEVAYEGRFQ